MPVGTYHYSANCLAASMGDDGAVDFVSLAVQSADTNDSALWPAGRAIHAILNVEPTQSPTDVFVALSMLATRQLPPNIVTQELEPKHQPRCCCFDLSSATPSWTTHSVCARCMLLYQLMRSCAELQSAVAAKVLVGTSILITDCASQSVEAESLPFLPTELIYLVIEHAADDMRTTEDGSAVASLLHVSSWARYKVAQNFEELMWSEPPGQSSGKSIVLYGNLLVQQDVMAVVCQAMREYWRDPSVRRHSESINPTPKSDDFIMTETGQLFHAFTCELMIIATFIPGYYDGDRAYDLQEDLRKTVRFHSEDGRFVRVSDVQDVLIAAIRDADLHPSPYLASPYYRAAWMGNFNGTDAQVCFEVNLSFKHDAGGRDVKQVMCWQFSNFSYEGDEESESH